MPQIKSSGSFAAWSACFGSPRGGFPSGQEVFGSFLGGLVFAQGWWWSFRSLLKPPGRSYNLNPLTPTLKFHLCCPFRPCLEGLGEFGFFLGAGGGSRPWGLEQLWFCACSSWLFLQELQSHSRAGKNQEKIPLDRGMEERKLHRK